MCSQRIDAIVQQYFKKLSKNNTMFKAIYDDLQSWTKKVARKIT